MQGDVEMRQWNDLGRLGIDEFQHVIKGERDVHALRHACEGIHVANAALKISHNLDPAHRQGHLVSQALQQGKIKTGIGLT